MLRPTNWVGLSRLFCIRAFGRILIYRIEHVPCCRVFRKRSAAAFSLWKAPIDAPIGKALAGANAMASTEATTRLASYGTLAPGKPNHHQLYPLKGRWLRGVVRGHL